MSRNKEYRTFKLEIRNLDESTGAISGYASVFGNPFPVWDHMEVVRPGAFKRTLKNNGGKVPILFNHYSMDWIGNASAGSEDEHGLLVDGDLLVNSVQKAKEVYALAKDAMTKGMKVGLSIGFEIVKDSWSTEEKIKTRTLEEIALWEWSITQWPANPAAQITDVRSIEGLAKTIINLSNTEREELSAFVDSLVGTPQPANITTTTGNQEVETLTQFLKACRGK